jgi:hypothetical protein
MKGTAMKRVLLTACCLLGLAATASAQIVVDPVVRSTYYAPTVSTPVTTYYAPRTAYYSSPVTTYYAPARTTYYAPASSATTTYYAPSTATYSYPATTSYYAPYTSYYAPASVYSGGTTVYRPAYIYGQPARNVLRAVTW